jgi:hypothetical protein
MRLPAATAIACLLLIPGLGEAAARVKSHSNTNNNRFAQQCAGGGGKVGGASDAPTCTIPKLDASSKESLRAACVKDGGQLSDTAGGVTCPQVKPTTSH